jgi:hypothetical protein
MVGIGVTIGFLVGLFIPIPIEYSSITPTITGGGYRDVRILS